MSTLYDYVVSQNMQGTHNAFWGNYDALNRAMPPTPSAEMIHNYQMEKLRQSQQTALTGAQERLSQYKEISDAIYGSDGVISAYTSQQNEEVAEAIEAVFENISEMREVHKSKNDDGTWKNSRQQYNEMNSLLIDLEGKLEALSSQLSIQSAVYEADVKQIKDVISRLKGMKTIGNRAFKDFWGQISNIQGDLLEVLGTAWFNSRMPKNINVKMATTGGISLKGHGQIIQDLMALRVTGSDLKDVQINFEVNKKPRTLSLGDFLDLMDKTSEAGTIVLDDEAFSVLKALSVLNVQAKSGKNQLPWNVNKDTSVAIADYTDDADGYYSVPNTFRMLYELDKEHPEDLWVMNEDPEGYYQAMANYGLATVLYKVMHLGEDTSMNQLLLTPEGFMTFSHRLEQLFTNNPTGYVRLNGHVFVNGHIEDINTKHTVSIPYWLLVAGS